MRSLKKALKRLGVKNIRALHTHPLSVKRLIDIALLPNPEITKLKRPKTLAKWGEEEFQGAAYMGRHRFVTFAGSDIKIRVIKAGNIFHPIEAEFNVADNWYRSRFGGDKLHVGDGDYKDGLIFTPLERADCHKPPFLLAFTESLQLVGYAVLWRNKSKHAPGCCVDPWKPVLYSWDEESDHLIGYDISPFYGLKGRKKDWGREVKLRAASDLHLKGPDGKPFFVEKVIQGAVITRNGRVFLTRARRIYGKWENYIYVFSALNGKCFRPHRRQDDYEGIGDEIEGVTAVSSTELIVTVLDNDLDTDSAYLWRFWHPDRRPL